MDPVNCQLIASRTKYGDGWRVEVDAEHISGRKAARVERCDVPMQGTAVRLSLDPETEPPATVREHVQAAARYSPLKVTLDGNPVEREDFLAKAVHVEEWRGVRIGVISLSRIAAGR